MRFSAIGTMIMRYGNNSAAADPRKGEVHLIMKRAIALILILSTLISVCCAFTSCFSREEQFEIAFVTDIGKTEDGAFNESVWNGVETFANKSRKTFNYYEPVENVFEARVNAIREAISKGARIVVCQGKLYETAVFEVQNLYPDVSFLLIEGEPNDGLFNDNPDDMIIDDNTGSTACENYKTAANVHCVLYREEQAGYLAGYSAVMDGYTKLGFLGGTETDIITDYGQGFVQGINDAAEELDIVARIVVRYWYSGSLEASAEIQAKMTEWYQEGTELIFACGGDIYKSAVLAATDCNGRMIGVDFDQSADSPLIVTSAIKKPAESVVLALGVLYDNNGKWDEKHSGQTARLGIEEDCVGLATSSGSWRFGNFTVTEYSELYGKVKAGDIKIKVGGEGFLPIKINVDYQP